MKFRLGSFAIAAGSLLSFSLVGCNPPVDEAGKNTTTPVVNPGPTTPDTVKPADTATPTPTPATPPPAVDAPKPAETPATPPAVDAPKPAETPAPAPKDEAKKEETPK